MKKMYVITAVMLLLFASFKLNAQTAPATTPADGEYRSNGAVNFTSATNWQVASGGNWGTASSAPDGTKTITLQAGNTATIDQSLVVSGYIKNFNSSTTSTGATTSGSNIIVLSAANASIVVGQVVTGTGIPTNATVVSISGVNITLSAAATATATTVTFTFQNLILFTNSATLTLSTGIYEHAANGGTVPTAVWQSGSLCLITGVTGIAPAGFGATGTNAIYNLTWNCPSQSANLAFNSWSTGGTYIPGTLTVTNTTGFQLRMIGVGSGATVALTIAGNIVVNGATALFTGTGSTAGPNSFLNIAVGGDITVSAGTLQLAASSNVVATYNLSGNFTMTGGTLTKGTPASVLAFVKAGTQTLTKTSGTISGGVGFNVNSGAIVNIADGATPNTGILNIPSASTFTIATGGALKIAPNATFAVASGGTATLNGQPVTIQSTSAGTGSIGTMAGTVTGATNITVERFIPSNGRKSYTMVTSPVNGSTIKAAWQEAGATVLGYGTQITGGTVGNAAANGFDTTSASGLSSIYTYNDANASGSKWVGLTNTNVDTLGRGKGYLLYVRGDRSEARYITGNSSNTTLRATGTLTTGNFTPVLTTTLADKFNLVANPYASAITWTGLTKANLTGSFYVYDPNLAVFVTSNGITVSPSASKQRVDTLQSGQAFFIQNASSGTPSITFIEAAKVGTGLTASANTVFSESSIPSQLNINLYNKSNELADGVVALFGNDYKAGLGKEDAAKMDNFNETFSLTRNNNRLSIEGRPMVTGNDTLFFAMSNFGKKEYVLQIDGSNFSEANATLVDNYTGTKTALDLAGITAYNFTVNGDAASAGNNRFMITFGSTATIAAGETADNNNLFVKVGPNPVSNQLQVNFKTATIENTVIKVINSLGQTVRTINAGKVNAGNVSIPAASLSAGLYTVQLISGNKNIAAQKIVKD